MTDHATNASIENTTPWEGDRSPTLGDHMKRNRKLLITLVLVVVGMFGFAFANIPLFTLVCQQLGFAQDPGKGGKGESAAATAGQIGREMEVRFTGNVYGQLPMEFRPIKSIQTIRLGEQAVNDYVFINMSKKPVYFRPIHSVRPTEAAKEDRYELAECFCYNEMMMHPEQELTLPVVYKFYPDLDDSVKSITMSYTLFPITKEDYEKSKAQQADGKEGKSG